MAETEQDGADGKKLRLFVAIELSEPAHRQLVKLSENLQKGFQFTPSRPSSTSPEGMHLTLVFLGATPEEKLGAIKQALDEVGARFSPLLIEVKRLGVFPNWRGPRVLWAGTRDRTRQIEGLHKALETWLSFIGYEPEQREYHPHVTLARFKAFKGTRAAEEIVTSHQDFKFGPFEAAEIVLFQSKLQPAGAQYTALHRARLSAPPKNVNPNEKINREEEKTNETASE